MTCRTCSDEGRRGYCAPLRCYCGHGDCHASASYVEPHAPDLTNLSDAAPNSWASREGSTWIDQM